MSLKQKAIAGVKWTTVSMVATTGIQFVTTVVLARLLAPADFGLMTMMMVIMGFAGAFADMGISNAIIHRQDATREQLSSLYWLTIFSGLVIFCIICLATPLVAKFYQEPRLSGLLHLTALSFLITPFGQQFQILLQKELNFNTLAKIEIFSAITNMFIAFGSALLGAGVYALIFGGLASAIARSTALSKIGFKKWRPSLYFSRKDLRGYLSFGLYQMGERTINYLNLNIDNLLIGSLLGAQSLGYYSMAHNIMLKPSSLINPIITKVAFPVFAKVQDDNERLKRGYLKVLQILSTINFPLMVGLGVTAPIAIPLILGEKWTPSIILVQILSIVGLIRSTGNPVGSLLLAKGRADLGFKWNLGLTITQLPGIYIGAKVGGAVGVASAFAILQAIYSVFNYLILIRTLLGPCLRVYVTSMWPALLASLLMGTVVYMVISLNLTDSRLQLLIAQVFTGVTIYTGCMLAFYKSQVIEMVKFVIGAKTSF